jgi:spermidine synthase
MAVIHSRLVGDTLYEVRNAGRSVRLYTNRLLHTQYHPERIITSGVWDLLALPALALPKLKRVLLLGVGGGAAIHLLRAWRPGVHITGVELNPVHLQLARRYFALKGHDLSLLQADAGEYVKQYHGEPFDLVIEDIFTGSDGEPDRVFPATRPWCQALGRLVSNQGALVINTVSRQQLRETAFVHDNKVRSQWQGHLGLTLPCYENAVGAFFRLPIGSAELRAAVRADARRLASERAGVLRYRIHRV